MQILIMWAAAVNTALMNQVEKQTKFILIYCFQSKLDTILC